MLSKSAHNCVLSWRPISDLLMFARFNSRVRKISIIQCYAPTESNYTDAEKDAYYSLFNSVYKTVPRGDIVIVMGDFSAQIGRDNTGMAYVMGKHGVAIKTYNGNGERFMNFCSTHHLVVGGSLFQHRKCHKMTYVSPGNKYTAQLTILPYLKGLEDAWKQQAQR